ncbi:unnamed protein product, partial [Discosporangium mesarthrocarpum]
QGEATTTNTPSGNSGEVGPGWESTLRLLDELMALNDCVPRLLEQVDFVHCSLEQQSAFHPSKQPALGLPPPVDATSPIPGIPGRQRGQGPGRLRGRRGRHQELLEQHTLVLVGALRGGSRAAQTTAARTISLLAVGNEEARSLVLEAGGLPLLLNVLGGCTLAR